MEASTQFSKSAASRILDSSAARAALVDAIERFYLLPDGVAPLRRNTRVPNGYTTHHQGEADGTIKKQGDKPENHGQGRHDVLAVCLQVINLVRGDLHGQFR